MEKKEFIITKLVAGMNESVLAREEQTLNQEPELNVSVGELAVECWREWEMIRRLPALAGEHCVEFIAAKERYFPQE